MRDQAAPRAAPAKRCGAGGASQAPAGGVRGRRPRLLKMLRVLSALVLVPVVVGVVWWLPTLWTLVLVEVALLFAVLEYTSLVERIGAPLSRVGTVLAVVATCAAVGLFPTSALAIVMAMVVVLGVVHVARGRPERLLECVAASAFALVYLAVPLGAVVNLRGQYGREAVLLFVLAVMGSDTFQYYGGRMFGRRPLAPTLSPHKTVEGALCGIVAGSVVLTAGGHWWLPGVPPVARVLLGVTVSACGIAGDLFESGLKRSAQVKDASSLIPGHGGMLDRLDAMLFALPVYYVVVQLH